MALNREWHRVHRVPQKAGREQRIKWHVAHAAACGCRAVPEGIRRDVEKLLKRPRKR